MNDVLPKPFTKEGMLRTLEKHLSQFKKGFVAPQTAQHAGVFPTSTSGGPLNITMSHSLKDEASPGRSPASSWNSPNQMTNQSPVTSNHSFVQTMAGNGAFAMPPMTPTHPHAHASFSGQSSVLQAPRQGAHRRVMSDMSEMPSQDDHPEKRQRMYPPQTGNYAQ